MADKLLFLSHAGVDSAAALTLAERIERAGLKVWIDKRDLAAGRGWQQQLEDAIDKRSTAFAVYVGSRGVVNWVDSEVRIALARATGNPDYPFIPVLAKGVDPAALPAFARQFQGVTDVEADPEALQKLLRAAQGESNRAPLALESQPFLGLSAFDEAHTHLFFGREGESAELVERLRKTNLLMVVGDSGSGKSSLVKAGLIPRFRGGSFAQAAEERPDETPWHVIQMRPLSAPFEQLVDAVSQAARAVGIDVETRLVLGKAIRTRAADTIRDAMREGAPPRAKTLFVVDQFEELWTQSAEPDRPQFIDALLGLARAGDFTHRIVLTMRRDYYNLCSQHPALFARVNARDALERYPLRRMNDAALRNCIVKPLALTSATNVAVFADAVLKDVGDQPGELALLEMALTEAWRRRVESGGNLLEAYEQAGRVSGALANAAEWVFTELLSAPEQKLAETLFMRLVRLGETGGTTRRIAARAELRDESWALAQRLADEKHKRLLLVTEDTAELAHEALVTQWPRYQTWLQQAAPDKRRLDALMDDAARWAGAAAGDKHKFVARGFDLENYVQLLQNETRAGWLSENETAFVRSSTEQAREHEQRLADLYRKALGRQLAAQAMRLLDDPRSRQLETAILLAVEAYRRHPTLEAQQALLRGVERLPLRASRIAIPFGGRNRRFLFTSGAGTYVAAADGGPTFTLCDMRQGLPLHKLGFADGWIDSVAFSADEKSVAAIGHTRDRVRLWTTDSGALIGEINAAPDRLGRLLFDPAGDSLAIMNEYGFRVRILRVSTQELVADLVMGTSKAPSMAFSSDGSLFAALEETKATVWTTYDWKVKREFSVGAGGWILFSPDGSALLRITSGTIQRWLIGSGERTFEHGWSSAITDAAFGRSTDRLAVASIDRLLRIVSTDPLTERQRFDCHEQLFKLGFDASERHVAAFEVPDIVRVWDLKIGVETERYLVGAPVRNLHFGEHGLEIVAGQEIAGELVASRYLGAPGSRRQRIEMPSGVVERIAISADGSAIACKGSGLRILSLDSGAELRNVSGDFGGICFDPRGEFLYVVKSMLVDQGVKLVSLQDESRDLGVACEGTSSYSRMRCSPDGRYFGVNSVPGMVTIWHRELDRRIEFPHDRFPREFEFLPGNLLMATLDDSPCVRIWDIEGVREIARLPLKGSSAGGLSIHPREPIVVARGANDQRAVIWDYEKEEVVGSCIHPRNVHALQISPCGSWLVTICMNDHLAMLWRLPDGAPAHTLRHFDRLNACAFSADGACLTTAGDDRTARVWDVATGAQLAQINRPQAVHWAGFLPDETWLVLRWGGYAEILAWRAADLVDIAGNRLGRNLSRQEWLAYMEDEAYKQTFGHLPVAVDDDK